MSKKDDWRKGALNAKGRNFWLDLCQFAVPILIIIIGFFIGSQMYAASVKFSSDFVADPIHVFRKSNIFFGKGYRLYNPFFTFILIFTKPFEPVVQKNCPLFFQPLAVCLFLSLFMFFAFGLLRNTLTKNEHVYGAGRLGNEKDLKKFGLMLQHGVVLGEISKALVTFRVNPENQSTSLVLKRAAKLICHGGGTNTLGIAPSRAGKGVTWVIPTLLMYSMSMIVFDPKGELYQITAGFRSKFSRVLKFSPISKATVRFNPLEEIELTEQAFADIGLILANVFEEPAGGKDGTNDFFDNAAQTLLTGVIFHILSSGKYPKEKQNLAGVLEVLSDAAGNKEEGGGDEEEGGLGDSLLHEMIDSVHFDKYGKPSEYIHKTIKNAANQILSMHEKVRSDTFSTVFTKMRLFEDPYIAYCTSCSDFKITDFYDSPEPISLYLTVPFSHIDRIAPVFKLIINFLLRKFSAGEMLPKNVQGVAAKKLKNRILFLLDEFPVLGKQPFISKVMGILAGYGINFFIIVQMLSQIIDLYGQNHTFLDNCKTVVLMAPGNADDAQKFSNMVGKESVVKGSTSVSGSRFSMGLNNLNMSQQDISRDIINPDELMHMPPDSLIIFNQGMPAYIAKKVVYYMDDRFKYKAYSEDKKGNCTSGWLAPYEEKQIRKIVKALPSNQKKAAGESTADIIKRAYDALPEEQKVGKDKNRVTITNGEEPFNIDEYLENYDADMEEWDSPADLRGKVSDEPPPKAINFSANDFTNRMKKEDLNG